MFNKQAAIVIPVYKPSISAYEEIAFKQCLDVLGKHPLIIVKPNSLVLPEIIRSNILLQVKEFDNSFFEDIHGYNRLMLSEAFYSSFADYKYILIYQLDAFVFNDDLLSWCDKGYDYIGAPWLSKKDRTGLDKITANIKNKLYVRYNVKYKDGLPKIGKQLENRVGNGGFSLRRVDKLLYHSISNKATIEKYLSMKHPWFNEDIFWSIELNRKKKQINIPQLDEALGFAFETYPEKAIRINKDQLPFGCHAWDKNVDFWRPYFDTLGYSI